MSNEVTTEVASHNKLETVLDNNTIVAIQVTADRGTAADAVRATLDAAVNVNILQSVLENEDYLQDENAPFREFHCDVRLDTQQWRVAHLLTVLRFVFNVAPKTEAGR